MDTFGDRDDDHALVQASGFWVPKIDASRWQYLEVFEGLPNSDVRKVAESMGHCRQRRTALDVGAHVGITATYMARTFDRVVSFEPIPVIFEALTRNTSALPNVRRENVAVGREFGSLRFEYARRNGQSSHALRDDEMPTLDGDDPAVTMPLPIHSIDHYEFDDVDFIKIDVEGFEGPVVEGARETILRCRPVIVMEQRGNELKFHPGKTVLHEASLFVESLGMKQLPTISFHKDRLYHFPAE